MRVSVTYYKKAVINTEYKDSIIRDIFIDIFSEKPKYKNNSAYCEFCIHYSTYTVSEISWNEISDFVKTVRASKFALMFIYKLLEQNLYKNEFADLFYKNMSFFDINSYKKNDPLYWLFCGEAVATIINYSYVSGRVLLSNTSKKNYEDMPYVDERMRIIIHEIFMENPKVRGNFSLVELDNFFEKYSKMYIEDISWIELCEDAEKHKCYKLSFGLIYKLLKKEFYHNEYEKDLYKLLPDFEKLYDGTYPTSGKNAGKYMCGNKIQDLHIIPSRSGKNTSFVFYDTCNTFLETVFWEFYSHQAQFNALWISKEDIVHCFEQSFGMYRDAIYSYSDFCEHTFWEQIGWYKNFLLDADEKMKKLAISAVCHFYRWLVETKPEQHYFSAAATITPSLLFTGVFNTLIFEDYYFITFNPESPPKHCDKICFILRNFDKYSTKLRKEDFFALDLSNVKHAPFKNMLVLYLLSLPSIQLVTGSSPTSYIVDGLNFLTDLKMQKNYPNQSYKYLQNQEAVLLRSYIDNMKDLSLNSRRGRLVSIRAFLNWCKDSHYIEFDDLFFDYLVNLKGPKQSTAEAISDEDISKILKYIIEDTKTNHSARLAFVIIRLLLETELRISEICNLQTNCMMPTAKPNQYRLVSYHKTGHGQPRYTVINNVTHKLLMDIIEETESFREKCSVDSLREYIFIREGGMKNQISLFRTADFRNYLKQVCKKVGLKEYTANNLRDTHMTKSLEYVLKNNKNEASISVLTGHRKIDTTKNHYIDWRLEELLEATYGLDLTVSDYTNKQFNVVDTIPEEFNNERSVVENGCGNCQAQGCMMQSNLPCLMCEHFVTTVAHQPYFEKAIAGIQSLINNNQGTKHDIEDLIAIKKLYVMYLGKIIEKREGLNNVE